MSSLSSWFWSESVWLPPNTTWNDISPDNGRGISYTRFEDLLFGLKLSVAVFCLKFFLEKKVFRWFGAILGLKDTKRKMPPTNDALEAAFQSKKRLDHEAIARLSKELGMEERSIERWLRQRTLFVRASKLDKFCEASWKAFVYTGLWIYSWVILWDKKWFWSITDCWNRYPDHSVTADVWWYYMIELAFYWSLMFSQFFDVQRSDFWEMFCHHVATILLLSLSWTCNLFKIGTLVLWVHDCADVFLESAKAFKYAGNEKISDLLFYSFAGSWMITRLGYFPTWIIYSITVEAPQFLQYFPAYNIFAMLLSILLILNLFWAYFIFKVAYLAFMSPEGKIERDLRSDSASSD